MTKQPLVSQLHIKIDGQTVQSEVMTNVAEVMVDQQVPMPDMFTVRLYDPEGKLLDEGPFDLAKEIEITAEKPGGTQIVLMDGEITALEPEFGAGMVLELVVRGYDKSHRLYRETKSKAFLNIKDSDLAHDIAGAADLKTDIEATSTVYDHVVQDNLSDLAFLRQRAWRIGYECFVREGTLTFRKPPAGSAAVSIKWGGDLLTFHPRLTLAEQVNEVIVRGWDADKLEAIVGQAENGRYAPQLQGGANGSKLAQPFGQGKLTIVNQPIVSQAEANLLAAARMDELSGAFVQAEGEVLRRPDVQAGQWIKLEGLGERLSGQYFVTAATHLYNSEGFQTHFAVRGSRSGLLADPPLHSARQHWPGVVPAIVTNTEDPNDWGRVKVKFPWMTDEAESDWARVVGLGVGPDAGFCAIPDVGDEVVVAFEQGEFGRPFVLGGTWNGQHALPTPTANAAAGEKPLVRTWQSRTGHWLAMHDDADNKIEVGTKGGHRLVMDDTNKKVELTTADGHKIVADDNGKKIEIISSGGLTLTMDDNGSKVTLKSGGDVAIEATGNMNLKAAGNMDFQASGEVSLKGTMIKLN